MTNKITILTQDSSRDATRKHAGGLDEAGWQTQTINVSQNPSENFASKFWNDLSSSFWGWLADLVTDSMVPESLGLWFIRRSVKSKLNLVLTALRAFQPPVLMATSHETVAIAAILKSRGLYRGTICVLFPNFEIDHYWINSHVDLYICNSTKQAETLKAYGINSSKTVTINHALPETFFAAVNREAAASEFSLLTTMPTIVVFAEADEQSILKESCVRLMRSGQSFQLVVVCGANQKVRHELESLTAPVRHPMRILDEVANLDVLLSAASVVITTMLEDRMAQAAAKKVPILLTDAVTHNQQVNLGYFLQNRTVVYGRIPAEVVFMVESALNGKRLTDLDAAIELIARPKNSVSLPQALKLIQPTVPPVKVQNYQVN